MRKMSTPSLLLPLLPASLHSQRHHYHLRQHPLRRVDTNERRLVEYGDTRIPTLASDTRSSARTHPRPNPNPKL